MAYISRKIMFSVQLVVIYFQLKRYCRNIKLNVIHVKFAVKNLRKELVKLRTQNQTGEKN